MITAFEKIDILGVRVSRLILDELIQGAIDRARNRVSSTILYANIHVLNTAYHDAELRDRLNKADVVYCDGEGVRFGSGILGRRLPGRMTGADWIEPLCDACAKQGISMSFIGSKPGVAERAALLLQERHAGLKISSRHHGFLDDPAANSEAIAAVNTARPGILLVGMGTPEQERWIAAHRSELDVPVVWAVGALFDFVTGTQPRGPRWMCDHGMEWIYRLVTSPRRLGNRYLLGNPLFVWRVLKQRAGLKR